MNTTTAWYPGAIHNLTEDECWECLTENEVGRIAWNDEGGPMVLPVNYLAEDGTIWIRTVPGSMLESQAVDKVVTFEADEFDSYHHSGWSVLLHGRAATETEHDKHWEGPEPWRAGTPSVLIAITPTQVTGRSLVPD